MTFMAFIHIRPGAAINESEISFTFTTSRGPGGQNVNKVATRAVLSFDLAGSRSLSQSQRDMAMAALRHRLTDDGVLQLACGGSRSQESNRREALDRLVQLLATALTPRRRRRKSRPTQASVERRLSSKQVRSDRKRQRRARFNRGHDD